MVMNNISYSVFCDFDNLLAAHHKARYCRRGKRPVAEFEMDELANLEELRTELENKTYQQGAFYKFYVTDPKKRQIQAIPYRDRIVQHILCDCVLTPYFTKRVVYGNCGCVTGRGQHLAVKLLKRYICSALTGNKKVFLLKCDIKKYFPSLSHEVIKQNIISQISSPDIHSLFERTINCYETPRQFLIDNGISTDIKRGVPIGNQSSQIIGYYYLNPMDRYIKEKLRIKYFVRYVDDFIIINNDKEYLERVLGEIKRGLEGSLKLQLNEKTQITPLSAGFKFLGIDFHIKDGKVKTTVQRRTIKKFKSRVKYANSHKGEVTADTEHFRSVFASYEGYCKHTATRGKASRITKKLNVSLKPNKNKMFDYLQEIVQDDFGG
jgi:hypothetical protein